MMKTLHHFLLLWKKDFFDILKYSPILRNRRIFREYLTLYFMQEKINKLNDKNHIQELKPTVMNMFKSSSSYFFWIALLSFVNTLLAYFGASFILLFWLGITQIGDAFIFSDLWTDIKYSFIVFNIVIILIFLWLNYFVYKGSSLALKIGMVLYALDVVVFIYFKDLLSIGSHIVVLKLLYDYHQYMSISAKEKTKA